MKHLSVFSMLLLSILAIASERAGESRSALRDSSPGADAGETPFPLLVTPALGGAGLPQELLARVAAAEPGVDLVLADRLETLTGEFRRYRQTYHGLEVDGAAIAILELGNGRARLARNRFYPQIGVEIEPSLTSAAARQVAVNDLSGSELEGAPQVELIVRPIANAYPTMDELFRLAYRVDISTSRPHGGWQYIVDAHSGEILLTRDLLRRAEGRGRVFNPNPVVALKDRSLQDLDDAREAIPEAAYSEVVLMGLEDTGYLDGPYVSTRLTQARALRPDGDFLFYRDQPGFEETMAYYHIDSAARYLIGLGFDFLESFKVEVDARSEIAGFDSYYHWVDQSIRFGTGGVDDGEEGEIIIHEYGHGVQNRIVPGTGVGHESDSISEGFSDFLAIAYFSDVSDGFGDLIYADWRGNRTRGPNFGRDLDKGKVYPVDLIGNIHADGEIWSGAMWEILQLKGRDEALRLVIQSQFLHQPDTGFRDSGAAILQTEEDLNDGMDRDAIAEILERRGMIVVDRPELLVGSDEPNDTEANASLVTLPHRSSQTSIATPDDRDYFRFVLDEPMPVSFGLTYRADFGELSLHVFGPGGEEIDLGDSGGALSTVLAPGSYLARVDGVGGSVNDYALEILIDNHGDTADDATPLRADQEAVGQIDYRGDHDAFSLNLVSGQEVNLVLTTSNADWRARMVLYRPNGALLGESETSAENNGMIQFSATAPVSGLYLVVVEGISSVDPSLPFGGANNRYRLVALLNGDQHGPCGNSRMGVALYNVPVTGGFEFANDRDSFRLEGRRGDRVFFTLSSSSSFDPAIRLYTDHGELMFKGDKAGSYAGEPLTDWTLLPEDGVYCVEIEGQGGVGETTPAEYEFYVWIGFEGEDDHGGLGVDPTPLGYRSPVMGVIGYTSEIDAFSFPVSAGQEITLDIDAAVNGVPLTSHLKLYDERLRLLTEAKGTEEAPDAMIEGFVTPTAGVYQVSVSNLLRNGRDLDYTLTLHGSVDRIEIVRTKDGSDRLRFRGDAETLYALDRSSDLRTWTGIRGVEEFLGSLDVAIDDIAVGQTMFFRARRVASP